MSRSLNEEDYEVIARKLKELLAGENPGIFVSRDLCNARHGLLLKAVVGLCAANVLVFVGIVVALATKVMG